MSTLEKMIAQMYGRKDSIIDQLQQQADSYTQQLASRLLIDGITPPPCLLSPNFISQSSNPNELEKEKIISRLLLRPPRHSTRYSTGGCSLYDRPVAARGKGRLSSATCVDNYAPNKAVNVSNAPTIVRDSNEIVGSLNRVLELDDSVKSPLNKVDARVSSVCAAPDVSLECNDNEIVGSLNCVPEQDDNVKSPLNEVDARVSSTHAAQDVPLECHNNDTMCSLNRVAEHDDSVESPQNETDARITSIYAAPDMSLARIQRSKSRQKARELRNSGKTTAKSCLSIETRTHISFGGGSNLHQVTQDKHPSEVEKCNDIIGSTSMALEEKVDKGNDRTSHSATLAKPNNFYENPSLEKDHAEKGSSSDKENLDCGIKVQPTGDSSQQDRHVNGVNLPHICLGSYASKKSRTRKKQGTENRNMPYSGRTTRSRSSRQHIIGINKSSNMGTSVSCNPKEGGGVLKPVISSNIEIERSSLGGNNQENAEIVVRNGPIDAPAVMQPVNSGIKLDLVTSDCCMKVKPKQLNFDEIGECGLNEICSPLSNKRKSDVMLGQECYPLKDSASSIDHKSSGNLFEQQLPNADVVSSNPKAARTESCNNTDECVKDVMINTGLETNVNSVVEDVEHNSMVSIHDDIDVTCEVNISSKEVDSVFKSETHSGKSHLKEDYTSSLKMQIKEGDLSHKRKESASGVFIPVSPYSKSSFISSLTKQGNKGFDVDLGSSISKDFEDGTNLKVPSMKLNSAKFNTCPLNQQKNVEYQPNCFSDSRKFRVPIQRDAIHLNLKTPENDLNSVEESASILSSEKIKPSQSHGIQSRDKSFSNEMICDLPDGTESVHEPQAAEPENDLNSVEESASILSSEKINLSQSHGIQRHDKSFNNEMMICDLPDGTESVHEPQAAEPENDLNSVEESALILSSEKINLSQSHGIQSRDKSFNNEKICDLPDGTESVHEPQAAEPEDDLNSVEESASILSSEKINLSQSHGIRSRDKSFNNEISCDLPDGTESVHEPQAAEPENDLNFIEESASILSSEKINLSQSHGIRSRDKSFNNEIICDLPEGTKSLHALQAAEATVTEVDDDTTAIADALKQFEPTADAGPVSPTINDDVVVTENNNFEVNLPEWVSSYDSVKPSQNDDKTMVSDEIRPVYEGFLIDEEIGNLNIENNEGGIDLDTLEIPSTTMERVSIIEQICKSASMQTPSSQFSHQLQGLYGFMADGNQGILDEDSRKHLQTSDSYVAEIDSVLPQHQKFNYGTPFYWQSENLYSSPTGKLWDRSASSSGSSEMQLSSNPELTCFPIEEDPNSNEENENAEEVNDELQENVIVENESSVKVSPKMEIERTENDYEVADEVPEVGSQHAKHVTKSIKYSDTYSSNLVSTEASVSRTCENVKHKPKIHHGFKVGTYNGNNRSSSIATRASTRGNFSEISKNKSILRSGIPRSSQKDTKRNNIVSNMTSFVSLVQQKQAAAAAAGTVKRDIKVKALEAAEATRRRDEEKENERRMKKEALKLERARIEKENAKQMRLNMIKKQEELKKKEADIAARKRLREEEEKKQVAKKRKLVAEKNQKLNFEKTRVGKMEIEKHTKNAANAENKKKAENPRQNKNANESSVKKQDNEFRTNKILANVVQQVESIAEIRDASNDYKATSVHEKSPVMKLTSQENSYDISPYRSDDDDDEEDDRPTNKFKPSWAKKNRVAMVLPLQEKLNPESLFSADSFCNMDEVLLPRRLHGKYVA